MIIDSADNHFLAETAFLTVFPFKRLLFILESFSLVAFSSISLLYIFLNSARVRLMLFFCSHYKTLVYHCLTYASYDCTFISLERLLLAREKLTWELYNLSGNLYFSTNCFLSFLIFSASFSNCAFYFSDIFLIFSPTTFPF